MQMLQLLTDLLVSRLGDILARRETSIYSVAYNNSGDDSDGDAGDGESDDGDGSDKRKSLDGLLFERPFDFDHFKKLNTAVSRDRDVDYTFRTNQLL
jgi:hypothetical protein